MKRIIFLASSACMLAMISCNNGEEKKEEPKAADTSAKVVAAPEKPVFSPFKAIMITHKVKDYAKWVTAYKSHDSVRMAHGISQYILGRGMEDSNLVIVIDKFTDVQHAKEFSKLPELKKAMQSAGVVSVPTFEYNDVIWQNLTPTDNMDRLRVTHHVKDYDAWKKVFDEEGEDARTSFGLQTRAISRSIDDPNMVTIVFAVTDQTKAKARVASPELKKLMEGAGVDGKPSILWYRMTEWLK